MNEDLKLIAKDPEFSTGGGCTAIHYDFGDYYVLVTNDMAAPTDDVLENEVIEIGLYEKGADHSEVEAEMAPAGRAGLNTYYKDVVGYEPDESGKLPIHELLDLVVERFAMEAA